MWFYFIGKNLVIKILFIRYKFKIVKNKCINFCNIIYIIKVCRVVFLWKLVFYIIFKYLVFRMDVNVRFVGMIEKSLNNDKKFFKFYVVIFSGYW